MDRQRERTAPFVAQYPDTDFPGTEQWAPIEETRRILPPSPWAIICFAASCAVRYVPRTLKSKTSYGVAYSNGLTLTLNREMMSAGVCSRNGFSFAIPAAVILKHVVR